MIADIFNFEPGTILKITVRLKDSSHRVDFLFCTVAPDALIDILHINAFYINIENYSKINRSELETAKQGRLSRLFHESHSYKIQAFVNINNIKAISLKSGNTLIQDISKLVANKIEHFTFIKRNHKITMRETEHMETEREEDEYIKSRTFVFKVNAYDYKNFEVIKADDVIMNSRPCKINYNSYKAVKYYKTVKYYNLYKSL